MDIPILVEPVANGFRALTGGPLDLTTVAATEGEAIEQLRQQIANRLRGGGKVMSLSFNGHTTHAPALGDNPLFEQFLEAVRDAREEMDAEDRAEFARRDAEEQAALAPVAGK